MSFESEMKKMELDAAFDVERYNREFTKDAVTKQYLLEQEDKRRAMDDATSQYFLDRELERKGFKSKEHTDLDSSIEELLKRYPSINLRDFSQILQQQSREQFIQRFSKEELEELIKKYSKGINNNGRRR